ncbi:MAG: UDP-2,3-diacylglucosamine hydrolase [Sulfurimonadaceae bacterium]|jgi:UDP-2,3-diacylglucosamine hydrolase|nr:UDP-2,3-diacylglucosamine hydrolase [Sulfurimonadaceae bacterium]
MFHNLELREGAFVVTDAHCSALRPEFLEFLKSIESKKLCPTQLVFLGDMLDALFGGIPYTYEKNKEIIEIINRISQDIELIYLEGNHDYNLAEIFPHAKVFPISEQPVACSYGKKKVYLSHGDFDAPFGYQVYTFLIRNPFVLFILRYIDMWSGHSILNFVDRHLSKKEDCKELSWFDGLIHKRITNKYKSDYFLEGHFHQNKQIELPCTHYINLGAFACNQRYFIVKSTHNLELLEEKVFS